MNGTATENVSIFDHAFYFPSLQRHRRIWVYLPSDYHTSGKSYPVIYMHDGQNLFDDLNAFGSEWGVDETLDAEHGEVIVIGIDNGAEHRMSEYMVDDHPDHGPGEGTNYLNDIVASLKPHVDTVLRTKPGREFTCIAGSSMGGLISIYAGIYFPHIFGAVGIFSPAIWIAAPQIFQETQTALTKNNNGDVPQQRWYLYAGALESETMVAEVAGLVKIIRQSSSAVVTYQLDAGGVHDEAVWKNYFPNFYKWFIGKKPAAEVETESHIRID